ncbi:hypothetical protein DPMN_013796 [Dreissena polymorpha]|uniref:Uncharacterized protein n=1 Tax=Dreissena polymorpha TaxID=45954 RepID=A0A9D4N9K3_DREPO|nr:hypothetical protein DPMN_013796 [Dreissena polymorpha]
MSSFDETVAIPRIFIFFMRCIKRKSCFKGSNVASSRDDELSDTDSKMPDESSTADVSYSWKEVVSILDAVLFVLFACILVASMLGCFFERSPVPKAELVSYFVNVYSALPFIEGH